MTCGTVLADAYDTSAGAHASCWSGIALPHRLVYASAGFDPPVWSVLVLVAVAVAAVAAFATWRMLR